MRVNYTACCAFCLVLILFKSTHGILKNNVPNDTTKYYVVILCTVHTKVIRSLVRLHTQVLTWKSWEKKVLLMVHIIVNRYFLVFYQLRSAYTGKQIIDLSDILAVIQSQKTMSNSSITAQWMSACGMCVCICVCVVDRERSWVFAVSANQVVLVVWIALYMAGYSDYLTGFCEPLLPQMSH